MSEIELVLVNPEESRNTLHTKCFVLCFGAYGWTRLACWADHLEDALEVAGDWIADNAPGLFCDDAVADGYRRIVAEGKSEEEAWQESEVDTTSVCSGNHHLNSWEWGIVCEGPDRATLLDLQHRPPEDKKSRRNVRRERARQRVSR